MFRVAQLWRYLPCAGDGERDSYVVLKIGNGFAIGVCFVVFKHLLKKSNPLYTCKKNLAFTRYKYGVWGYKLGRFQKVLHCSIFFIHKLVEDKDMRAIYSRRLQASSLNITDLCNYHLIVKAEAGADMSIGEEGAWQKVPRTSTDCVSERPTHMIA